jgi:hypothetical protein
MDKAQVHEYCERQIERNYNEVGVSEGKWIIERYKKLYVHLIKSRKHIQHRSIPMVQTVETQNI